VANKFTVVEEKHCTEQMSLLTMYLARKSSFNASIPIAACLFPPFDVTNPKNRKHIHQDVKPPKDKGPLHLHQDQYTLSPPSDTDL
jgi:hypothetical protein